MPSDEANNPTRAAVYARVSSDLQSAASIEDQLRICAERATKEGWQVAERYFDQAISGASLIRPGIQKLLQDAAAGRFEIVLTESVDRVSRDQEDIAHVFKRMHFLGTRIVTLSEGEVNELHIGLKWCAVSERRSRQDAARSARPDRGRQVGGRQQLRLRRRQEDRRQWGAGPRRAPDQPATGRGREAHLQRLRPGHLPPGHRQTTQPGGCA